jgi:hypothetical protein
MDFLILTGFGQSEVLAFVHIVVTEQTGQFIAVLVFLHPLLGHAPLV